jgi:hypothetical protein
MNIAYMVSMHRGCTEELLARARTLGEKIEYSPEKGAWVLRKMAREVGGEIHRLLAFIRLADSGGMLHGYAKAEHKTLPLLAARLARRTPGRTVVIGANEGSFAAIVRPENGKAYGKKLGPYPECLREFGEETGGSAIASLWKEYYWSQYAESRDNPRQFSRNAPKKFRECAKSDMRESAQAHARSQSSLQNWLG